MEAGTKYSDEIGFRYSLDLLRAHVAPSDSTDQVPCALLPPDGAGGGRCQHHLGVNTNTRGQPEGCRQIATARSIEIVPRGGPPF